MRFDKAWGHWGRWGTGALERLGISPPQLPSFGKDVAGSADVQADFPILSHFTMTTGYLVSCLHLGHVVVVASLLNLTGILGRALNFR